MLILAHPAAESFNHFVAASVRSAAESLGEVDFVDLYRENFHPVLTETEIMQKTSLEQDIQNFGKRLESSDYLIFVYPEWWGGPPALLKGFLDRMLRPGTAYDYIGDEEGGRKHVGLWKNKSALVFSTTDTIKPDTLYPPEAVWAQSILPFCGITHFSLNTFFNLRESHFDDRQQWLVKVRNDTQLFIEKKIFEKKS